MLTYINLFLIIALGIYVLVKDKKVVIQKIIHKSEKSIEAPSLSEGAITPEKADEILRRELGDEGYKQLISDQMYGNVG